MTSRFPAIQPVLAHIAEHLDDDASLSALAAHTGWSPFHLHRVFSAAVKETPKRFTERLRLERAAASLLTTRDSVLDVALSCGFQSHESFCRTFRRRFKMTPSAYRARGFINRVDPAQARGHAALVHKVGPCVGLYHMSEEANSDVTYSITKKDLLPQPVLIVRRRVKRSEIAATIAEGLGHVFRYAQEHGIALAGLPFTRYPETGPGLVTMEPGMRIASSGQAPNPIDPAWIGTGAAEVIVDTLPGGPAAVTTHAGSYDNLQDAYAAIEQWIEAEGLVAKGPPWESYITDPTEHPDPKDWKTEVFWPL